jgi:hypothetical protein
MPAFMVAKNPLRGKVGYIHPEINFKTPCKGLADRFNFFGDGKSCLRYFVVDIYLFILKPFIQPISLVSVRSITFHSTQHITNTTPVNR